MPLYEADNKWYDHRHHIAPFLKMRRIWEKEVPQANMLLYLHHASMFVLLSQSLPFHPQRRLVASFLWLIMGDGFYERLSRENPGYYHNMIVRELLSPGRLS